MSLQSSAVLVRIVVLLLQRVWPILGKVSLIENCLRTDIPYSKALSTIAFAARDRRAALTLPMPDILDGTGHCDPTQGEAMSPQEEVGYQAYRTSITTERRFIGQGTIAAIHLYKAASGGIYKGTSYRLVQGVVRKEPVRNLLPGATI